MMLWYNFVSFLGILQVPSPLCYPGNITCLVEKCKEKGAMSLRTELGGKINFWETGEKCSTCSCKATGCTGIPGDTRGHDACGVCAGLNSTCADCAGVPWGTFTLDRCGICNGGDKSCIDKSGKVCALPLKLDQCGICGGDGTTCSDCRGVIGGSAQYDACGAACDLTHQCTSTIVGIKAKDLSFALEKDLKLRNSLDIYDSILAYSYTNNVHYNITQNVISLQSGLRGCVEMLCEFCNDKHYKAVRHSTLCGYRPPIGTIEIAPFKTLNDMCGALTYKNPTLVPTKSPTNTLQPSARPTLVNISTPLYKTGYSDSRKSTFGVIAGIRLKGSSNTMVLIQSWYRNNNTVAIKLVNAFEHSLKNCLYTHADRNPRVNAYEVSLHNEELIFRYRIDVNAIETSSLCPLCTSMSLTQKKDDTGNLISKKKLKTNEIVQGEALLNSKDEESSHNFKGTQYLGKNGSDGSKRVAITIVGAFGNDKNFDRHFKASKKLTENPPKNKIYHIKVLQRGIDLMEKFDHDNILALIGVAHGVSSQIIVTPLCEGSLERLLKLGIVDFQIKPRIGQDCAVAMEYLSGKGFVFWDLAARNILLDENFKSKLFHLEVCDFGMRSPSAHSYLSAFGSKKIKWPAPEVLNLDTKYTSMSDVWHYGLLLYEIWTDASIPYGSDWIDERANASLSRSSQHVDLGNIGNNRVNPDYWNDEEVRSMAEHYFQVTSTFSEREVRTPHEEVVQVMNRLSERHV
eukprot:UC4_evm3s296